MSEFLKVNCQICGRSAKFSAPNKLALYKGIEARKWRYLLAARWAKFWCKDCVK